MLLRSDLPYMLQVYFNQVYPRFFQRKFTYRGRGRAIFVKVFEYHVLWMRPDSATRFIRACTEGSLSFHALEPVKYNGDDVIRFDALLIGKWEREISVTLCLQSLVINYDQETQQAFLFLCRSHLLDRICHEDRGLYIRAVLSTL